MALLAATDVPLILWLNEHLGPLEIHSQRQAHHGGEVPA